jgi:CRP/FNR family cyclic AMP-dependent transcriptional regulator
MRIFWGKGQAKTFLLDGINQSAGGSSMQTLQLIHSQTKHSLKVTDREPDFLKEKAHNAGKRTVVQFPAHSPSELERDDLRWPSPTGEFFRGLSDNARIDFGLLSINFRCPSLRVLISEQQRPSSILFLLEGQVTISMNSSDGRRFLLGVAHAGDILGLTSAISGDSSEIRAEARYPCKIATMLRRDFLEFLLRYPIACHNVVREISLHNTRAYIRLRTMGVNSTTHARLACLLLEWCTAGQETESGTEIRSAFTHEEIGDCIGASRESVSRTFKDFKERYLVRQRGSTLLVPSREALAHYAGVDSIQVHPNEPATA